MINTAHRCSKPLMMNTGFQCPKRGRSGVACSYLVEKKCFFLKKLKPRSKSFQFWKHWRLKFKKKKKSVFKNSTVAKRLITGELFWKLGLLLISLKIVLILIRNTQLVECYKTLGLQNKPFDDKSTPVS